MIKEKSCGAIIYNNKKEVLLVKHNAGHWDFPKGHVEKNETEQQTALREIKEETNLEVKLYSDYRYDTHYSPKENVEKTVIFFLATNITNNYKKQDSEIADIGWYSYDDALKLITYDNSKENLKKSYKDIVKIIK